MAEQKWLAMADRIRSNPVVLGLSAIAVIVTFLKTLIGDVSALVQTVQPLCWGYADAYVSVNGAFKKEGDRWVEYHGGVRRYEFEERGRFDGELFLLNLTEREDEPNWRDISVRIPRCGGAPEVNSKLPPEWVKLDKVWRG